MGLTPANAVLKIEVAVCVALSSALHVGGYPAVGVPGSYKNDCYA